jgi:iron complex outermembrane receptor protein
MKGSVAEQKTTQIRWVKGDMMRYNSISSRRPRFLAALLAGIAHLSGWAQQAPPAGDKTLPSVEVVGSRIPRTDWETAVPVQVITREEIRRSGADSTEALINNVSAASTGALRDFRAGGGWSLNTATVSLRGLGSNATLVLLNGRRLPISPSIDPNNGFSTIYNLNTIPLAAIERIEVLKGGGSAIYGSDAVAGVVNIILREDYRGAEAGIDYSFDGHGNFGHRRVHATIGFGDIRVDGTPRYNGLLVVSNTKRDKVYVQDTRAVESSELERLFDRRNSFRMTESYPPNYFIESVPGSGFFDEFFARDARCPATSVNAVGRCTYDQWPDFVTIAPQDSNAVLGRINVPITSALSVFSEFGLTRVRTDYTRPPFTIPEIGRFWRGPQGEARSFTFVLPAGHPDNPASVPVGLRYTFADVGRRETKASTDTSRILLGAKGTTAGWEWDTALLHTQARLTLVDRGLLYAPALTAAIATQAYRPYGNNSPETLAAISPDVHQRGRGALMSWDIKGTRTLGDLAGGPLRLAAGVEARREEMKLIPGPNEGSADFIGRGVRQANSKRHIEAIFMELSAPFLKNVEAQLAVRHDRYSDYGNSTTPQLGIKWKPHETLALRSTYSKGFRAPALSQIGFSSLQGTIFGVTDPLRCGRPGSNDGDCDFILGVDVRENPNIKPEKSSSQTIGLVFSPNSSFDASLDYYRINRTDEISLLDETLMVAREADFPGAVIRNPNPATWLPGIPNSGPIQGVINRFTNISSSATSGLDAEATLRNSLGSWGRLETKLSATYLLKFKAKFNNASPFVESPGGFGPFGPLPRFKGSLGTTWHYDRYAVTGRVNHVSGWKLGDSNGCFETHEAWLASYNCRIKGWTTFDLAVRYSGVKDLDLGLSISNLLDKAAPLDPNNRDFGFGSEHHNPYGRYFTVWLNYKFL